MKITALLMAGGKATRMGHGLEKSLISIQGQTMIERVIDAIQESTKVDKTIVVVSPQTPKTAAGIRCIDGIELIEALGQGYIQDMRYAVKKRKPGIVLVISADLPLITAELIDQVISKYENCEKPALTVAVTRDFYEELGFFSNSEYSQEYGNLIPAGINIIDGAKIDEEEIEEEVFVLNRIEIAANINSPEDLKRIREMLEEKGTHGDAHQRVEGNGERESDY